MRVVDLGSGHFWSSFVWDPDLELNPQYAHLAEHLPLDSGGCVWHPAPEGSDCLDVSPPLEEEARLVGLGMGAITFDLSELPDGLGQPRWTVVSREPLTLSPSILCKGCGDHGFIRDGRWVPA